MNDQSILASLQSRGFPAWQATFVASFLEADSPAFQVLAAPPGTGKTYSCIAIAAELAAQGAKRILVLSPAFLCEAWRERLRDAQSQVPVFLVTRRAFREMEAAVPIGQSPWDGDGVFVISQDLAKQSDFAAGLSAVTWDLVIIDEADRLAASQRGALLDRLMVAGVVRRLLLLTATPLPALDQWLRPSPDQPARFPSPLIVTSWFDVLRNWDGSAVERPRVNWEVVPYTRGADEVQFLSQFLDLMPVLETADGGNQFLIQVLTQRAASSPFAVEQSLQRLGHTLKSVVEAVDPPIGTAAVADAEPDLNREEFERSTPEIASVWADKSAGLRMVERCLEALDAVATDEKLNTLRRLVQSIVETQTGLAPKICVFSMYADTVAYLHTAVEDLGITSFKITGATSFTGRQATVERFREEGGLLVGTDAGILEGIDLLEVTHVIHYDLPSNSMVLEQRHGRFDRYGRNTPCTMYVLRDESGVMPLESRLIDLVTSAQRTDIDGASAPADS